MCIAVSNAKHCFYTGRDIKMLYLFFCCLLTLFGIQSSLALSECFSWNSASETCVARLVKWFHWHVFQTPGFLLFALPWGHHEVNVSGVFHWCKLKWALQKTYNLPLSSCKCFDVSPLMQSLLLTVELISIVICLTRSSLCYLKNRIIIYKIISWYIFKNIYYLYKIILLAISLISI